MREETEKQLPHAFPRTFVEDYRKYSLLQSEYLTMMFTKQLTSEVYDALMRFLDSLYREKLHREDYYSFSSLEEFDDFLRRTWASEQRILQTEAHEIEHFTKAVELGYSASFGVWVLFDAKKKDVFYVPYTRINEQCSAEDYVQIKDAPSILSEFDQIGPH